ncbi:MAG: hypothetical protein ACRCZH_08575 [Cetobacterium sp.]
MSLMFFVFLNSFSIALYPTEFDKNISLNGDIETYYIRNESNETKIYTVEVMMENEEIEKVVLPRKFVLEPGKSKDVKVFMKTPEERVMEHKGYLLIAEAPVRINSENNVQINVKLEIEAYSGKKRG